MEIKLLLSAPAGWSVSGLKNLPVHTASPPLSCISVCCRLSVVGRKISHSRNRNSRSSVISTVSSSLMSDALVNGLAGVGGGILAQIITYPLQTVNTRQQTERKIKRPVDGISRYDAAGQARSPPGTLQQMIQLIEEEGWEGLFSGLMPSLLGTAASQGVYYYFYEIFRSKAETLALARYRRGIGDGTIGAFSSLISAAIAGCLNVVLTTPIWVVVTRMQTQAQAHKKMLEFNSINADETRSSLLYSSLLIPSNTGVNDLHKVRPYRLSDAVKELYKEAGIKGFWKGVIPSIIMVCNPSIQFMIYESLLKQIKSRRAVKKVNALEVFILGAIAKLGATVCTYPLLVVKSRLQAKQEIGGNKALQYTGTFDAIVKMLRYEGIPGFYKGMSTKIVQSVFAAALLFMTKEEIVKLAFRLVNRNRHAVPVAIASR